ncbi:hypothetical protein [Planktothrix agardhii]|uniref:hypothetical protein n=1 Tax=Planktothrix agardhii TaxID=1160 RepID=UPI002876B69F|nr:hypothetical protein [Planktothrix agardhii]MDS1347898.1 hypothetical protein [Planktothrix agardhii NRERC-751]
MSSGGNSGSGGSSGGGSHWGKIRGFIGTGLGFIGAALVVIVPAILPTILEKDMLCNLKVINVNNFLKCDDKPTIPTETPVTPVTPSPTPSYSPSVKLPKQDNSPSQSPNSCEKQENSNTVNIGSLDLPCTSNSNISPDNLERRYRFKIDNPSNISLFLDGVNSEVEMSLYSDKDGTGVIGYRLENVSAFKSKLGIIKKELGVGSYIIIVKSKARDTPYSLQIINNTSQIQNIGYLEDKTIQENGSISLNNREHFYRFQLANPSNISLSLSDVNSEVGMSLSEDKDGTGVIGSTLEDTSAFNLKPGIIKKQLGVGSYIVVVRLKAKETNYNLTMSAP